ncbi:uncharacterized protein METZ01_LOCUS73968, partial [marine metagenome]
RKKKPLHARTMEKGHFSGKLGVAEREGSTF